MSFASAADRAAAPVAPVFTGGTRFGGVELFDRVAGVPADLWRALFPPHWKDRRYYETLEETFAQGFEQRLLVLRDLAGTVRAVQPLFFVAQDLAVSLPAAVRRVAGGLRRLWPGAGRLRMLMVGCIVGEWQIGAGENPDWPWLCAALDEALSLVARHERVGLILFKDVPAAHRRALDPLRHARGFARFPSLPAVRLPLDFASFDDYLERRLGKATRKSLRRKFRETAERCADEPIVFEVKTRVSAAEAGELHRLYESVARRGDFQFEVFDQAYFLTLSQRMPEQAHYFTWRRGGKVIAFCFCMVFEGAIYDNDLGLDYEVAHELNLYQITFRDLLGWAMARGLKHYHSSPFNYQPKLHLRMELAPLDIYARHRWRPVQAILRRVAPRLEPTRQEPVLREFPNAAEIWRD